VKSQQVLLLVLGALWGASFLFMRVAAPEIGAIWLIECRVLIAGLVLLPWVLWQRQWGLIHSNARDLLIVGALNSAIPFVLIAYITITVTAGTASILNAIVPIVGVIFGYFFAKEKLTATRLLGIVLGFFGVMLLMLWQQVGIVSPSLQIVCAAVVASISYVAGAHYTKHRLVEIPAIVYVTGTQLAAALLLAPLLPFFIPQQYPSIEAISSILGLAIFSTALAFVWYFKLIHQIEPTRTLMVTYLIPLFGLLWGAVILGEAITLNQVIACALILFGVALSMGNIRLKRLT